MNCSQIIKFGNNLYYHYYGIRIIQKLQYLFEPILPFFELISWLTRPGISYYFIFPIVFFIGPHYGVSVLWAAVISEALNTLLKIFIQGDRPYWWVKENAAYYCRIAIKQYPSTCEISPGTPSGHAFVTTAVSTMLMLMWCNCFPETCVKRATKILSIIGVLLICMSRAIIGAHFPHQVLLGVFLGMLVARILLHCEIYKNSPIFYFRVALLLFLLAIITKYVLPEFGFCSCWSVIKAKKYCQNSAWIPKCMTRPSVSYLKLASILTSAGLSMLIISALKNCKVHLHKCILIRIFAALCSVLITSFIYFKLSKYSATGPPGYSFIILKNMMVPLTVIVFVPITFGIYHT